MTKTFTEYLSTRPVATDPIGPTDVLLVVQAGSLKKAAPQLTAVLTDINGSGERCQVTGSFDGLADDGVTKLWSIVPNPL